jgi:cell division protein ZapB
MRSAALPRRLKKCGVIFQLFAESFGRLLKCKNFRCVDRHSADIYSRNKTKWHNRPTMENQQFKLLERKVTDLIHLCEQLDRENRVLKTAANGWQQEREQLVQKTEIARSKVEAMIVRLKALEQES